MRRTTPFSSCDIAAQYLAARDVIPSPVVPGGGNYGFTTGVSTDVPRVPMEDAESPARPSIQEVHP
jgi:hypothetical protein